MIPRASSLTLALGLVLVPVTSSAQQRVHVDARGAQGVRADLERIVASEEGNGWFLDRTHFDAIYPVLLQTVCRASSAAREDVLATLDEESKAAGDPRELFNQDGRRSSRVDEALHLQRMRDALQRTLDTAERDCPFWVRPSVGYDGRQTDRKRFSLSLETGGLFQVRQSAGAWGYGAGGGVRILPGYGFGRFSLLGGIELTGGAMTNVVSQSQFTINYLPAIPLVLRIHDTNWHYDFEIAGVGLFQGDNTALSMGTRVGMGIGLSALRTRFFIPWAGLAVAYEYYFENDRRPMAHFFRGGLRIGFQWDP
jgi:hypothetical protein